MKQTTRQKVLEKAISVLARSPQSTMGQIAAATDTSRATLYRYFKTKESLVKAIIVESDNMYNSIAIPIIESDESALNKLTKLVNSFAQSGAKFHFLLYNDYHTYDENISNIYNSQTMIRIKLMSQLKDEGVIDANQPIEWLASSLEFIMYAAWEGVYKGDIAINKASSLVLDLFLNGAKNIKKV